MTDPVEQAFAEALATRGRYGAALAERDADNSLPPFHAWPTIEAAVSSLLAATDARLAGWAEPPALAHHRGAGWTPAAIIAAARGVEIFPIEKPDTCKVPWPRRNDALATLYVLPSGARPQDVPKGRGGAWFHGSFIRIAHGAELADRARVRAEAAWAAFAHGHMLLIEAPTRADFTEWAALAAQAHVPGNAGRSARLWSPLRVHQSNNLDVWGDEG